MVAKLQKRFLKESYPSANHIHIKGADRRMIYKKPSAISQHLRKLVHQQQAKPQSEWPVAKMEHPRHGQSNIWICFKYSIKYSSNLILFLIFLCSNLQRLSTCLLRFIKKSISETYFCTALLYWTLFNWRQLEGIRCDEIFSQIHLISKSCYFRLFTWLDSVQN